MRISHRRCFPPSPVPRASSRVPRAVFAYWQAKTNANATANPTDGNVNIEISVVAQARRVTMARSSPYASSTLVQAIGVFVAGPLGRAPTDTGTQSGHINKGTKAY